MAGLEHDWRLIEGIGDTLYFVTNKDAPKLKVVVKVDLSSGTAWFTDVVPESANTL